MAQGRQGRLVVGFVALHVLCCGLPLLLGAGFLGGAGQPPSPGNSCRPGIGSGSGGHEGSPPPGGLLLTDGGAAFRRRR